MKNNLAINYKTTFERRVYVPEQIDPLTLIQTSKLSTPQMETHLQDLQCDRDDQVEELTKTCRRIELVAHLLKQIEIKNKFLFDPRDYKDDQIDEFDSEAVAHYKGKNQIGLTRALAALDRVRRDKRQKLRDIDKKMSAVEHLLDTRPYTPGMVSYGSAAMEVSQ